VRRATTQFVAALGLLIGAAVLDLGPRAAADYVAMPAMTEASGGCSLGDASERDSGTPPNYEPERVRTVWPAQPGLLPDGGGMSPTSSGGSPGGSSPAVAVLSPTEPIRNGLVAYFREPAAAFDLSAFIDPILDPPRRA